MSGPTIEKTNLVLGTAPKMTEEQKREQEQRNKHLLSVERVSNTLESTVYRISFNGALIFDLVGERTRTYAVPSKESDVNPRQLRPYSDDFGGREAAMKIDPNAPFLTIAPVGDPADPRGIICPVSWKGTARENEIFTLNATYAGKARGGHYHTYDVEFGMPRGMGAWLIGPKDKPMSEDLTFKFQNEKDRVLPISAGDSHLVVAVEDMLITEVARDGQPFSATNDINRGLMDGINNGSAPEVIEALHRQLMANAR